MRWKMLFNFAYMETLLPFMLVVAIVYGGLETAGMFRNRAIRTIIAVVLGFFSITNYMIVQTINSLLPFAAIAFLLLFVLGFAKKSISSGEKDNTMIIIILALGLLFIASVANAPGGFGLYQYTEFLWLIGVVIIGAILYAAYRMR
jgi:hypothetical protein